jgi:hydrogenase maturation protease
MTTPATPLDPRPSDPCETHVLVVGVGHPDRGDDAVGWLVAERLRSRLSDRDDVEVVQLTSDPAELLTLAAWNTAAHVVLVDAVVTGAPPGTVDVIGDEQPLPSPRSSGTHDLGLAAALQIARSLDRLPRDLTIVGVEGARFGIGDLPSPAVVAAAERVALGVEGEIRSLQAHPLGSPR